MSKERLKQLREQAIRKTQEGMKESITKDKIIVQSVSATEDLAEISNLLSERLREWYGLHHPEFKTSTNKKYAESVISGTDRKKSTGIELSQEDLKILIEHASFTKRAFDLKESIEKYIEKEMASVAPNITSIVGPVMGAKLMSLAGSLEKLAKMPASTIQLLGAEKALFRFIKEQKRKGDPPKYGVIFSHEHIQRAKPELRGKVARLIASKLAMAARTDFYTKEDKSDFYRKGLEKKIGELK